MTAGISERAVLAVHNASERLHEEDGKMDGRLLLSNGNVRFLSSSDTLVVRSCRNCCQDFVASLDTLEPSLGGNEADFCSAECEISFSLRNDPVDDWQSGPNSRDKKSPVAQKGQAISTNRRR